MSRTPLRMALALLLCLSALAAPLAAQTNSVGEAMGTARVGKYFNQDKPCTKTGMGQPEGQGLYAPGIPQEFDRARHGVWQATLTITNALGQTGTATLCGYLDRVANTGDDQNPQTRNDGEGASCHASKGFAGRGQAVIAGQRYKLYNVGWKVNKLAVLDIVGTYQELIDNAKTLKTGKLTAQLTVTTPGPLDCTQPNGAKTFNLAGPFQMLNTGGTHTPNDPVKIGIDPLPKEGADRKECKTDGPPAQDVNGDGKKDKPGTVTAGPCPANPGPGK